MPLNGPVDNERWDEVMDTYYEKFSKVAGTPLIRDTQRYERFSKAVRETTPLFNSAATEEEFDDAIAQMKEVLELRLLEEKRSA